jgi:hypothetical protein
MEKITLSEEQIGDLYKDLLLSFSTEQMDNNRERQDHHIDYKGGFAKKILWLHYESEQIYIHDQDFDMLTRILEACKMTWDDIALVNLHHSGIDQSIILKKLNPEFVILSFGDQNKYQIQKSLGMQIVYTHPLHEIRNDKNIKVLLWQALKIFFNLK